MDKPEREPVLLIEDLETLKVITDPLRLQILEVLSSDPHTIHYVADRLGLSSSRLYYHFNLLESHGLIRVVETRIVNNIVEKVYWTTAKDLSIDNDLFKHASDSSQEYVDRLVKSTLDAIRDDIIRSLEAGKYNAEHGAGKEIAELLVSKVQKRISNETYLAYQKKLKAVLEEFNHLPEAEENEQDMTIINLYCFMYPSHYYNDTVHEDGKEK